MTQSPTRAWNSKLAPVTNVWCLVAFEVPLLSAERLCRFSVLSRSSPISRSAVFCPLLLLLSHHRKKGQAFETRCVASQRQDVVCTLSLYVESFRAGSGARSRQTIARRAPRGFVLSTLPASIAVGEAAVLAFNLKATQTSSQFSLVTLDSPQHDQASVLVLCPKASVAETSGRRIRVREGGGVDCTWARTYRAYAKKH